MRFFRNLFRSRNDDASLADKQPAFSIERTISKALTAAGLQPGAKAHSRWSRRARSVDNRVVEYSSDIREAGLFLWKAVGDGAATLDYKLYVPTSYSTSTRGAPLIVMLHGCTQDPDDFALGTRMNVVAEEQGALVAYPQQSAHANGQKCWNWFRPEDQLRNSGEPERIAAATRAVISDYRVDPRRVFIVGMSAGGAMAVIMGRTYPDLFCGVGVHSGLPYRCANNVVSALSVMRDARTAQSSANASIEYRTPMIVFRGSADHTVNPANGDAIVRQTVRDWPASAALSRESQILISRDGMTSERTIYRQAGGQVALESWLIRNGGHRWSGGDARGSHTDVNGPDASAEIMRFFLETGHSRV